jgi:hypothetical protein
MASLRCTLMALYSLTLLPPANAFLASEDPSARQVLQGYEIADFGRTVTLNLVYDYVGMPREKSHIRFSQVALYLGFYGIVIAGSVKQIPN